MPRTRSAVKEPTLVSVVDAAKVLGCHPDTIRRRLHRGEIRRYRLGPQILRVNLDEIYELMRQAGE